MLPLVTALTLALSGSLTVTTTDVGAQRSLPPGAHRVQMLELSLEASCDADISIRSLQLRRRGMGDATDIAGVYLMDGTERITNSRTISSRDGRANLALQNFVLSACERATWTLAVDIADDAAVAGEHRFTLEGIDAPGAMVQQRSSASRLPSTVRGTSRSTVTAIMLPLHRRPLYGDRRTLARIRLDSTGSDDVALTAMTLTNDGSARDGDLRDLVLVTGGGKVLTKNAPQLDGNRLRLVFSPAFVVGRRDERLLELRGNVRASRKRTVEFTVQEEGDIEVMQ